MLFGVAECFYTPCGGNIVRGSLVFILTNQYRLWYLGIDTVESTLFMVAYSVLVCIVSVAYSVLVFMVSVANSVLAPLSRTLKGLMLWNLKQGQFTYGIRN